jgi:hypothetical protein
MATTGKKEYTLRINGIDTAVKESTSLLDVLKAIDSEFEKNATVTAVSTKATKEKAKALTEEEKAAKKLEETQRKIKAAQEGVNDAQIKANQALREATREQTLRIQGEQASANSIEAMRVKLSQLKDEWKGLDVGTEEFRAISEEIRVLNDQIKEAEQSTGDFRRNVGNYESALGGLSKLTVSIEGVTKGGMGLAQTFLGATSIMALFGNQSEEDAARTRELQKIIALLSIAQQVNTNILKEGIVQNKLAVVTDTVRALQLKAKTAAEAASTKGTIAATVAQKIFNVVAAANPYVLLAMALVAVGTALFAFASKTETAAKEQKKLNELQNNYLDTLEDEANKVRGISSARVAELERQLKILEARGAKQEEIREKEDQIATERKNNNEYLRGYYAKELEDLEANKKKIDELREKLRDLQRDKAEGKNKVPLEVNGKISNVKIDGAIDAIQGQVDALGRSVEIATTLDTENKDLEAQAIIKKALRERENREAAKAEEAAAEERLKAAAESAKKRVDTELSITRAAEDARLKLIQDGDEQARKTLEVSYNRQIEDLRRRLKTETELSAKARKGINDTILSLEEKKGIEIEKLEKERAERTRNAEKERADAALALQQELEDSRASLIKGGYDRQRIEINIQYGRQIEAYKKRLAEEKTLTEEGQKQITELILNAQEARNASLSRLTGEQLNRQAEQSLTAIEDALKRVKEKIGDFVVRSSTGLNIIDVDATRKNFDLANAALGEYISGLKKYLGEVKTAHMATLETMEAGTEEYTAELQNYAHIVEDVNRRIGEAYKEQDENVMASAQTQMAALRELLDEIKEYADAAVYAISSVFDTWSMGLEIQLDNLNEQLDAINEKYEQAKKQREKAVKSVEDMEARLQMATGGTAEVIRAQLQDSMQARAEADREEQRLAREKEKREAEIAKKEKQIRRNDLIASIAQAIVNTAQSITKALTLGPILGIVFAGIVGAIGAAQVGIMTNQLTKMADGGELKGPSHAKGGMRIQGSNIEVEGGEYVINRESTVKNKKLVSFINSQRRELTASDLNYFFNRQIIIPVPSGRRFADGGELPSFQPTTAVEIDYERLANAVSNINIRPVVSVADINDVNGEVVTVKDLAGF